MKCWVVESKRSFYLLINYRNLIRDRESRFSIEKRIAGSEIYFLLLDILKAIILFFLILSASLPLEGSSSHEISRFAPRTRYLTTRHRSRDEISFLLLERDVSLVLRRKENCPRGGYGKRLSMLNTHWPNSSLTFLSRKIVHSICKKLFLIISHLF